MLKKNAKSGKFILRITPALHQQLASHAQNENLSLNDFCSKLLATGIERHNIEKLTPEFLQFLRNYYESAQIKPTNINLITDYFKRAKSRLKALQILFNDKSWADVMRESQKICELILKGVLRQSNIDPPRIHDVSLILQENEKQLPTPVQKHLKKICMISKSLRRDRELAFYGSEDLTPSEFYTKEDADLALEWVKFLVETIIV